jgi:hypothetical protein
MLELLLNVDIYVGLRHGSLNSSATLACIEEKSLHFVPCSLSISHPLLILFCIGCLYKAAEVLMGDAVSSVCYSLV